LLIRLCDGSCGVYDVVRMVTREAQRGQQLLPCLGLLLVPLHVQQQ